MRKKNFEVGDIVTSKLGSKPFTSEVYGVQRAPCFGNEYEVLLEVPGFGRQWWRDDWCKEAQVGNQ